MIAVRRIRVKGLKDRFRVTLFGRDGTYALSVPKSRLGHLLLPVARAHPFEVRLKNAVTVDVPRGVKPVGKAMRKLKYAPLRPRRKKTAAPAPKIDEVTSAVIDEVKPAVPAKKSRKKKAAATAV